MTKRKSLRQLLLAGMMLALLIMCQVLVPRIREVPSALDRACHFSPSPPNQKGIRIVYCVSWYPSNGPGATYEIGRWAKEDTVNERMFGQDLMVERRGTALVFNGYLIQPGETFRGTILAPSFSPFLEIPADFTLTNAELEGPDGAVYALAEIRGGWYEWK